MTAGRVTPSVSDGSRQRAKAGAPMLLTVAVIFLVLWLVGLVALPAAGTVVHVLLVLAVIAVLMHFLGGRRGSVTS